MRLRLEHHATPLETLLLATDEDGRLRALEFADREARMHRALRVHYGHYELLKGAAPASVTQAIDAYFDGDFTALDAIDIATEGTPFQRDVWRALRQIPAGETRTYGQIAKQIGRPTANRAVGAANGANPISIVVPCHRVIGASGALTGYGGGMPRKRWLLDHERPIARTEAVDRRSRQALLIG